LSSHLATGSHISLRAFLPTTILTWPQSGVMTSHFLMSLVSGMAQPLGTMASFVAAGVLNPELFFASNREMLLVAVRVRPVLADIRAAYKDPSFLKNLETVAQQFSDYLDKAGPGTLEAFVARVGG